MQHFKMASLLLLAASGCASHTSAINGDAIPTSQTAIDRGVHDAFLFAFPVYQMARTRAEAVVAAQKDGRTIINRFGHRARLAGPQDRLVTTPNNDTLYSAAWIDLADGPVVLTIPPLPGRYNSVALMDIFTDNFAVLGTREQGPEGGSFMITGPDWHGRVPTGMVQIPAPTNDVWAIVRVLVDGPDDLAAAAAAQRQFSVEPLGSRKVLEADTPPSRRPEAQELLREANRMLTRSPLPKNRAIVAAPLTRFGVGSVAPDWDALEPAVRESWTRQLPQLMGMLREGFASVGSVRDGWSYPKPGMGRYGDDEFYRAAVSLGGLAALPVEEASYLTGTSDADGQPLDGSRNYTLTIPANVPVKSFWSLSMYEIDADGRLFFTPNPIERYAVGNRTTGLFRNADGSITLYIQHAAPSERLRETNWLPAPEGPFRMTFRGYHPQPAFISGEFQLPAVTVSK